MRQPHPVRCPSSPSRGPGASRSAAPRCGNSWLRRFDRMRLDPHLNEKGLSQVSKTQPGEEQAALKKPFFRQKKGKVLIIICVIVIAAVQLPLQIFLKGQNVSFDSVHIVSPTNASVEVRNIGFARVTLVSYYVTYHFNDTYHPQYANTTWSGPALNPGAVVTVNILIDGKAFTFQSGNRYSISITSSTGHQNTLYFTA